MKNNALNCNITNCSNEGTTEFRAISQQKISDVTLRTLKPFESGKGIPTLETLQKLYAALGYF